MKTTIKNDELVTLYLDVLSQPLSQRYNIKELIFDVVPAKRMLYQVFIPLQRFSEYQSERYAGLSTHDLRFVIFLESTDFTDDERARIFAAHAEMGQNIPEKYRWRAPMPSKGFLFYGRKFGRPAVVSRAEVDQLYERQDGVEE